MAKKEVKGKKPIINKVNINSNDNIEKKIKKEIKKLYVPQIKETKLPTTEVKNTVSQLKNDENFTLFGELDIHLFKEGAHYKTYNKFGSHIVTHKNIKGVYFSVWAPNASYVSVIGNFNGWNKGANKMNVRFDSSGIWEIFIPNIGEGEIYKYFIENQYTKQGFEKADPYAKKTECPPKTGSIVSDITSYKWNDTKWMENTRKVDKYTTPTSVYELHLGSFKLKVEENNRSLTYKELADELVNYILDLGFTHVEFMPIMEHPFYGSWGYQTLGYFAPTARYGSPEDLMYLIDKLHQNNIGVILDWVPSHFPNDGHGLAYFDGTHLYEHEDLRKGFHPDWTSCIYNYGRNEVRCFLISSAMFWCDFYHVDGLRIDGVASMLYLDYSRKEGEWIPNIYGGRENLEAIQFLKDLNINLYKNFPDIQTIAEESTSWGGVSKPIEFGGLGFGKKWMMGWMHDVLEYMKYDPIYRKYHHNMITFSMLYFYHENFVLPLSHDEVVHGKGSIISRMPGDEWQRFANLRLLYSHQYFHPGDKLIFMGNEFGQYHQWNHENSLDWHLLNYDCHKGIQRTIKKLNSVYRNEKALHDQSFSTKGFEWIDISDWEKSILIYERNSKDGEFIVVIENFTPSVYHNYEFGIKHSGEYEEIYNSDEIEFWGSGIKNNGKLKTTNKYFHNRSHTLSISIPPLSVVALKKIN